MFADDRRSEKLDYWVAALLVMGIALAVYFVERENDRQHASAARVAAQDHLAVLRSQLVGALNGDVQLVKGMVSVIAARPELSQREFERAAQPLFGGGTNLRNIGAAPDMVIRMMYPMAGNEGAIGLDYRKTPAQFEMADRARTSGRMVMAGPLPLAQGGIGIVARIPVFVEDASERRRFWGLISAVIDVEQLYRNSGLLDDALPVEVAIRGRDGKGSAGEVFFGRPELFDEDPVLADILVAGGSWQMAAAPRGGWPEQAEDVWTLRSVSLLVALLLVVPFIALGRSLRALGRARRETEAERRRLSTSLDITSRELAELAEREKESRFRQMFEHHSAIMLLIEPATGRIVDANPAAAGFYGYPLDALRGMNIDRINTMSEAEIRDAMQQAFAEDHNYFVFEHRLASGEVRSVEVYSSPISLENQQLLFSIIHDISKRKLAESDLRIAATAFESREGVLITDAESNILRVNSAFTEITGYPAEEVVGRNPRILSSGHQDAGFYAAMWDSLKQTGSWSGEILNRRRNGEIYPEHLTITAVKGEDGRVTNYVAMLADITQRKEAEEKIRNLAFYDPLTRLPNRRLLLDRLQQGLAASARTGQYGALLFIDLDNFKGLNDTLGHDVGDLLLKQVAERLKACVREGDTVARLGGDEFVVILEGLGRKDAEAAAHTEAASGKIAEALNEPFPLGANEHVSTPSIGATLFIGHQTEIDDLLKQADIAMYQAKKAGRNTMRFFDPVMQSMVTAHVELEADLRRAVSEQEQLQLYYQIQVDARGRSIGVEALVRWNHPVRGSVSPAEFIPLAEESGLILPLGHWVLATACSQLSQWAGRPEMAHLTMAVNISPKQFALPTFVDEVAALIGYFAIDPAKLKLEVTEGMLADDVDDLVFRMAELKKLGVSFSMDDFGTGYSSLQYLKRLPLDQLKIDQSFVRDIATDASDRAIVKTVIAMAGSLDLEVIAEGVETEEQRAILLKKGCKLFQGYLFGRPLPVEQFEALESLFRK